MSNNYLKIDWQAMPAQVQQLHLTRRPYGWLIRPLTNDGKTLIKSHELATCRGLSFSPEPDTSGRYANVLLTGFEGDEMCLFRPKLPQSDDSRQKLAEWWTKRPAWANFAARDADGRVFLYSNRPRPDDVQWTISAVTDRVVRLSDDSPRPPRVSEDWKLDITERPAVPAAPQTFVATGGSGGGSGTTPPPIVDAKPRSGFVDSTPASGQTFPHNAGEVTRKVEEAPTLSPQLAAIYLWWAEQPSWANYAVRDGDGSFENYVFVTDKAPTYRVVHQTGARIWQLQDVQKVIRVRPEGNQFAIARNQCMARPEHWWIHAPSWARFAAKQSGGEVGFYSSRPRWSKSLGKWVADSDGPSYETSATCEFAVKAPFANLSPANSLIKRPAQVKKPVDPAKRAEAMQAMAQVLKAADREYYTMDTFLQHAATSFFRKSGQKVAHAVRSVEPEGVVLYKGGRISYRDLGMYHERYDTAKGKWVPGYHFIEPTPAT